MLVGGLSIGVSLQRRAWFLICCADTTNNTQKLVSKCGARRYSMSSISIVNGQTNRFSPRAFERRRVLQKEGGANGSTYKRSSNI